MGMGVIVVVKLSISLSLKLLDPILLALAGSQAVDRAKRSHAKELTTEFKKLKTVTHI
jgi:hypothetical protein